MDARSLHSEEKAYVRFTNKTNRTVELIWLNYNGEYVKYRILESDNYIDVNTYKTHPWIAVDARTRDRLMIDKSYIYNPKTSREYIREHFPDRIIPENFETRIRASVTLPLYSLKYRALIEVRKFFRDSSEVEQLDLPKNLADELKRIIEYRNSQLRLQLQIH